MLKRSSMRELFDSLHDDFEQTNYEIVIAETLALKSLEKATICELDVHEFARKFIELASSIEIGKFHAISLNKYGQVEKLDFSEYGFDYVNYNRKGKFHSILKQVEAEKERSNLLILLYP
ncbi:hypothetical protein C1E24_14965 [Pseudoalteromonas phenolica]|uniref:Uncharacterized protein n=1 Tax=Pseudoalteromonas phenolica TaxID=161398 RepID=A0A5R9PYV1_9GAMM|nr:hypothetical protein [Pseudoalteromonas phenolica]TLX46068.1 hypothetical protein C1E24_14965 [Pseudoalteromonas phenolica]